MNREIEFRAFIEYKNLSCGYPDYTLMLNVHSIDFVKGTLKAGNLNETYKIKDVKLLEYTGLKDKNGVKIFEGDIVKLEDSILRIIYDDEECRFVMTKEPDNILNYHTLAIWRCNKIEVIGNIYENPELLNE